ncbi:MAG TPA: CAP domain-containing protein [Paucimonas sp.]|nr:CAP domain-containing protein [Paucimonas sp.]
MRDSLKRLRSLPPALWMAFSLPLALTACGGGGSDAPPASVAAPDPNAPQATGNTATDGFNRFNYRRQQAGLSMLTRNAAIDTAAQGHSDYQRINNVTTHVQEAGKAGFTGAQEQDRLRAAGYVLPSAGYAFGEVISSRSNALGADAAEDLIGAIYHRFIVLEPMFKEAGAGAATGGSTTWFTADFAAIGLDAGLARGGVAVYPFSGQTNVATGVNSDEEEPDPVPNQNRVGYPVSVHANLTSTLTVQSFTLKPRGGADMAVRLLTRERDPNAPASAAAVIPLSALAPATTYDVQFSGAVDGIAVNRAWSFTTQ